MHKSELLDLAEAYQQVFDGREWKCEVEKCWIGIWSQGITVRFSLLFFLRESSDLLSKMQANFANLSTSEELTLFTDFQIPIKESIMEKKLQKGIYEHKAFWVSTIRQLGICSSSARCHFCWNPNQVLPPNPLPTRPSSSSSGNPLPLQTLHCPSINPISHSVVFPPTLLRRPIPPCSALLPKARAFPWPPLPRTLSPRALSRTTVSTKRRRTTTTYSCLLTQHRTLAG